MRVDHLPHDREAQAGALRLGGEERVEDAIRQLPRHAWPIVGDIDDDGSRGRVRLAGRAMRLFVEHTFTRRERHRAGAFERLERINQKIREKLAELMMVALDRRQTVFQVEPQVNVAARHFAFGEAHRVVDHVGNRGVLDLQPNRPHELERLVHDAIRHLRFVDDVVQDRLRVRRLPDLPLQHASHHLDAGQRVFHLVRDGRRHFAKRHQAVSQPLAFFHLLDFGQILEEHRDTGRATPLVVDARQRVADHLAARFQPQLGAIGQMAQLERVLQHPHHVRMLAQHLDEGTADGVRRALELEDAERFVVHFGNRAVAGNRQHAIAHAGK